MRNAPASVEIDLQVDENLVEETLDMIEAFLDSLGHIGLIRTAHIRVEDHLPGIVDVNGPMLTDVVQ